MLQRLCKLGIHVTYSRHTDVEQCQGEDAITARNVLEERQGCGRSCSSRSDCSGTGCPLCINGNVSELATPLDPRPLRSARNMLSTADCSK